MFQKFLIMLISVVSKWLPQEKHLINIESFFGLYNARSVTCNSEERARKNHEDSAIRFVTANRGPQIAIEIRQYIFSTTICSG